MNPGGMTPMTMMATPDIGRVPPPPMSDHTATPMSIGNLQTGMINNGLASEVNQNRKAAPLPTIG